MLVLFISSAWALVGGILIATYDPNIHDPGHVPVQAIPRNDLGDCFLLLFFWPLYLPNIVWRLKRGYRLHG